MAIPLEYSVEVITIDRTSICPIPGVASALMGVMNQRGRLLWILELSNLLALPPEPPGRVQERLTILVLSAGGLNLTTGQTEYQVGCVVSYLKGIIALEQSKFQPVPGTLATNVRGLLTGMAEIDQLPIALLNVEAVISAVQNVITTSPLAV